MTQVETSAPGTSNIATFGIEIGQHCATPIVRYTGLDILGIVYSGRARKRIQDLEKCFNIIAPPYAMPEDPKVCRIIDEIEARSHVGSLEINRGTIQIGLRTTSTEGWEDTCSELEYALGSLILEASPDDIGKVQLPGGYVIKR